MLIRESLHQPGLLTRVLRSRGGLWFPGCDFFIPKHKNVLAILDTPLGRHLIPASNIVTDDGDIYYAQSAAGETPTNNFDVMLVATAGTPGKGANLSDFTLVTASQKAFDGTYPKTNDGDADNTGAGVSVVTFLTSWTKADFNQVNITHGLITMSSQDTEEPLLTGYAFGATFTKTANDTLKVFVNHTMLGV